MVDGWLARKLHAETNAGAVFDSVADIIFVVCCAIRLLPVLVIPTWLWIWAGVIVFIKIVNQISSLVVYKRFCFPHTLANKLTGLLLFFGGAGSVLVCDPSRHRGGYRHLCRRSGGPFHQNEASTLTILIVSYGLHYIRWKKSMPLRILPQGLIFVFGFNEE